MNSVRAIDIDPVVERFLVTGDGRGGIGLWDLNDVGDFPNAYISGHIATLQSRAASGLCQEPVRHRIRWLGATGGRVIGRGEAAGASQSGSSCRPVLLSPKAYRSPPERESVSVRGKKKTNSSAS